VNGNLGQSSSASFFTFHAIASLLATRKELVQKLAELERKIGAHGEQIQVIFEAIRQLMTPPEPRKRKIGFLVKERAAKYGRSAISPMP